MRVATVMGQKAMIMLWRMFFAFDQPGVVVLIDDISLRLNHRNGVQKYDYKCQAGKKTSHNRASYTKASQ